MSPTDERTTMQGRPAESLTGTGAIALLAAVLLGATNDPNTIACLGAVLGLVPAAVTLLVSGGGVRGVLGSIWRGRSRPAPVVEPEPPAPVPAPEVAPAV